MIPILRADFIYEQNIEGGTTFPFVAACWIGRQIHPYVVKIFNKKTLSQYHAVTNEYLGSQLAQEFDLKTPPYALIDLSDELIREAKDTAPLLHKRLKLCDDRLKFGSSLITPHFPYSDSLRRNYLDLYDIETIYAFDILVHNVDRTIIKPNLFFYDKSIYLIDHEHSFSHTEAIISNIKKGRFIYPFRNHVFYPYLSKIRDKSETFHTFHEYLRNLNLNRLDLIMNELRSVGYDHDKYKMIYDYFCYLTQNPDRFITLLRQTL